MVFRRLAINAKFLSAEPTGVHLVAHQLIRQLAQQSDRLSDLFPESPCLVSPSSLKNFSTEVFHVQTGGLFNGQLWEQLDLPRLARGDFLLNLCNLGPVVSASAMTMIHDAQVFSAPSSYGRAFASWYRGIYPLLGRRSAHILTVSEFSARELVQYRIARREDISVVHNGVDHVLGYGVKPAIIDRLVLKPRQFAVGLANVQPHKNIPLLLKAFANPALVSCKLVLIGSADRARFESLGHAVPSNVVFAGRVSDGELRALLESALCLLFPSLTEGFGLPPLEGMLLGCPAVLAPCGALKEIGGEAAIYAPPDDPREWAAAIQRLRNSQEYWETYSRLGRARAALFTWERAGDALIKVIRRIVTALNERR